MVLVWKIFKYICLPDLHNNPDVFKFVPKLDYLGKEEKTKECHKAVLKIGIS